MYEYKYTKLNVVTNKLQHEIEDNNNIDRHNRVKQVRKFFLSLLEAIFKCSFYFLQDTIESSSSYFYLSIITFNLEYCMSGIV